MKKTLFWFFLIIIPMFALVVSVEIFYAIFISSNRMYKFDSEIGWVPKSNLNYSRLRSDITGGTYTVTITTNNHGFRAWGDINAKKVKILFIGDSFTGDDHMSDEDSYYGQVKKIINAEIFAFGGGGYGTLQELMILRKYVVTINPDYFVLQFCTNDYVNNSFYLERSSIVRNQKNFRPYLDGNTIIYRLTPNHWYKLLCKSSAAFRFLDQRLQRVQYNLYDDYHSLSDTSQEKMNKERIKAENITERLLVMMANSVPQKTKLLTFSIGPKDDATTEKWVRIAKKAGFIPLPMVSKAVENAEKEGVVVRSADGGHWSPQGHRIAGKELAKQINRLMAGSLY